MIKSNSIIKIVILFTIALFIISSCKKDKSTQSLIPNVWVDLYLQPDGIDFIQAGNWKYYNDYGYKGIIVYRIDQFTFSAYERCCSYDPQIDSAKVEVDNSGIILVDSICGSKFNILDGNPIGGPATLPLKQYFTEYSNGFLHVFNTP